MGLDQRLVEVAYRRLLEGVSTSLGPSPYGKTKATGNTDAATCGRLDGQGLGRYRWVTHRGPTFSTVQRTEAARSYRPRACDVRPYVHVLAMRMRPAWSVYAHVEHCERAAFVPVSV